MTISAADVKALRERTGAGIMECRNALEEVGGDATRAAELLRERGAAKAAKKVVADKESDQDETEEPK